MDLREALRLLKTKLAAIEREHREELADNDTSPELSDKKAEARALAALFDFLRNCKISQTDSLLRALERYLRKKSTVPTTTSKARPRNRE